ncbi:MAG: Na+:solute symporter [Bacteroidota bacterium]|nr:MAG: Na+:solute symporter [Bacteroidota bacterium]
MIISTLDWLIIAAYFVVSIAIGIILSRRAGNSTSDFFLSGRKLPWYIAGTSMVATTFAADTPLAVTELVAQKGIAGNWLWWNFLFGGMLTVFFFARLWRRSEIMTDAEFVSIRYSGMPARFLRGFRAVYVGILMNAIVVAWVNLAMVKILQVIFPDFLFFGKESIEFAGFVFSSHLLAVACLMLFVAIYSSISGLWGVSYTDTFQFIMAMAGSIALAVFALRHPSVGGIAGLKANLPEWVFHFTPEIVSTDSGATGATGLIRMTVLAFIAYMGVQWWSSWYPGAEPGGGGYVAQRMMSAKDEKHSLLATLWFQIAHYALRPWPWIIVALAGLVMYPDVPMENKGATYVMVIRDILPSGMVGLMLAAFLAAYMSTIASQTVWGTSYIINDLYRPFVKPSATEKHYVRISRITTFVLMLVAFLITSKLELISQAWKIVLVLSGGIGLVLILRWFWYRINAWTEIAAMLAPYAIYPVLKSVWGLDITGADFEVSLMIIVAWTTLVWLVVTLLTKPSDIETLKSFYTRVHPGGAGWKKIAALLPHVKGDTGYARLFANWFLGCLLILFALFAIGKFIFGEWLMACLFVFFALLSGAGILFNLNRSGWNKIVS